MELRVKRAPRIDIEITVPGDKSISHRAVVIAALSNGVCTLQGFLPSEDCRGRSRRDAPVAHPGRFVAWHSLSTACGKRAGERRIAAGGPLCKGQDHCDRAGTDSRSYGDDV